MIDGNIIASQSAGIAMGFALAIVGLLLSKEKQAEINCPLVRSKL